MSKNSRVCGTCARKRHIDRFTNTESVRCDTCKDDRRIADGARLAQQKAIECPDYSRLNSLWIAS